MLPSESHCDACSPSYATEEPLLRMVSSTLPFVLTFLLVAVAVHQKVYPLLSSLTDDKSIGSRQNPYTSANGHGFAFTIAATRTRFTCRNATSVTFSATIALSAVLAELLLCEISNSFNPIARKLAMRATVASLLFFLIVAIPLLEIFHAVDAAGWKFVGGTRGATKAAWSLELLGYTMFAAGFWLVGNLIPRHSDVGGNAVKKPVSACLERSGVIGTLMMALLSGFAATSAIWQNFAAKHRPVTEADISRKEAGLDAACDLLAGKRSRLRQLRMKVTDTESQGFWQQALGTLRKNGDVQELKALELEISGLKTMSISLENSLSILRSQRSSQLRAATIIGRITEAFSYLFSCYCAYRITSTLVSLTRKSLRSGKPAPASNDPITHVIALVARHIYPSLNQSAWSRQISFLMSGVILMASFNAVLQTFHLICRIFPCAFKVFRSNKPLVIAQIAGLYTISSALMLRNVMPQDVGGVINDALGARVLHPAWTENWFEAWFMGSVLLSTLGIWLSQKIKGGDGTWDDDTWDNDVELGKRS